MKRNTKIIKDWKKYIVYYSKLGPVWALPMNEKIPVTEMDTGKVIIPNRMVRK